MVPPNNTYLDSSWSSPDFVHTQISWYSYQRGVLHGSKEKRRRFSREFKLEAIRMVLESGRKQVDIAGELGINPEVLYRWTREHRLDPKQSFPGNGTLKERDRPVEQLHRENRTSSRARDEVPTDRRPRKKLFQGERPNRPSWRRALIRQR